MRRRGKGWFSYCCSRDEIEIVFFFWILVRLRFESILKCFIVFKAFMGKLKVRREGNFQS